MNKYKIIIVIKQYLQWNFSSRFANEFLVCDNCAGTGNRVNYAKSTSHEKIDVLCVAFNFFMTYMCFA